MSDTHRIARRLRTVGCVSPLDFDGSREIADGLKPIKRMAARIKELREEGWRIRTDMRDGVALYVLTSEPGEPPVDLDPGLESENFDRIVPAPVDVIAQWAQEDAA